ncbi:Single-stranded-DNA-specific exonuclease RecJ [hydrothermal vent metagenome]|uniref:Single-stranded-DNA-specific exonuclease RecJ n=1 Tax=hydrothermal vent metagenome TaxID=652676 RepID=A0A3B0ZQP1_9ZZZZ
MTAGTSLILNKKLQVVSGTAVQEKNTEVSKSQRKVCRRQQPETLPDFLSTLPPILARVYSTRNIQSAFELDNSLNGLLPYQGLKGMDDAVRLLVVALQDDASIMIVGDFDADGATSTVVAIRALRLMGYANVSYLVPNRFEYGYGLTPEIVDVAQQSKPDIIITVDNGIASIDGVERAKQHGIKVLVTDHHLPADTLPDADAIVNPNQLGDTFKCKSTAGVGVIFYTMLALRAALRDKGWFTTERPEPNLAELLDLVALGTVADVVPLEHNNRILVAQGIARIRAGKVSAGLNALIKVAGRNAQQLKASDMGFSIAPRINAAGRLDDMSIGIECLLSDDEVHATAIATQLDSLNYSRREIEGEMKQQAFNILDEILKSETDNIDEPSSIPAALCLYQQDWHEGVIGILASRIKEHFHRPVIAFALSNNGSKEETLKGSARSIQGLHLRDVLDEVSKKHPHLIEKFGGHAMAAGLTLKKKNLNEFKKAFVQQVDKHLTDDKLKNILLTDGSLDENEINLDMAELIQNAGPWGQNFPEPVFDGQFDIIEKRIVGEKHLKLVLGYSGAGSMQQNTIDAIAFNVTDESWPVDVSRVDTVYRLDVNEFRGNRTVQLMVEQIEPVIS